MCSSARWRSRCRSPRRWWGLSPRWNLGLIHSDPSVDQSRSVRRSAYGRVRTRLASSCPRQRNRCEIRRSVGQLAWRLAPRAGARYRSVQARDHGRCACPLGARPVRDHERSVRPAAARQPHAGQPRRAGPPVWFAIQPAAGWAISRSTRASMPDFVILRDGKRVPVALDVTARLGAGPRSASRPAGRPARTPARLQAASLSVDPGAAARARQLRSWPGGGRSSPVRAWSRCWVRAGRPSRPRGDSAPPPQARVTSSATGTRRRLAGSRSQHRSRVERDRPARGGGSRTTPADQRGAVAQRVVGERQPAYGSLVIANRRAPSGQAHRP